MTDQSPPDKKETFPIKYRMTLKFDGFERVVEGEYPAKEPELSLSDANHIFAQLKRWNFSPQIFKDADIEAFGRAVFRGLSTPSAIEPKFVVCSDKGVVQNIQYEGKIYVPASTRPEAASFIAAPALSEEELDKLRNAPPGGVQWVLNETYEQALHDALACYSPDDSATDWADKIRALSQRRGPSRHG